MSDAMRLAIEPRGLQREVAARYVGVSPSKFDEMVLGGRMPRPKLVDRRKIWDRRALDEAFDAIPSEEERNPFDSLLEG